ncbi:MAG: DUF2169 domain-containing protein, partial [Candidatus Latescibacteria bacterium]|nr:DUF2169 domain-containing protein [Candidatus Latescibacterota bacterium]
MNTIKPDTASLLYKTFRHDGRYRLSVGVFGGFFLSDPPALIAEEDFLEAAVGGLGKTDILDAVMPKPRGEVLVAGSCFAPDGIMRPVSQVRVAVGRVDKTLAVFGDRFWKRMGDASYGITDPEPFTMIPVTFQKAFGGPEFPLNPAGKGAAPVRTEEGRTVYPLPNIENPDRLIGSPADKPSPAGFSPIAPGLPQRTKKLGTFDDEWRNDSWPYFPKDIDWSYFNAAPPDQWIEGYFAGNEAVTVVNMHPKRRVIFSRLPGVRARCFASLGNVGDAAFREVALRLDTVWLFPASEMGIVLFHGTTSTVDDEAADVSGLFAAWEPIDETPKPAEYYRDELSGGKGEAAAVEAEEAPEVPGIPKAAIGIAGAAVPWIAAAEAPGAPETGEAPLKEPAEIEAPTLAEGAGAAPAEAPEESAAVDAAGTQMPGGPVEGKSTLDEYIEKRAEKEFAEAEKKFCEAMKKAGIENPEEYLKPTTEHLALMEKTPEEMDAEAERYFEDAERQFNESMKKAGIENPGEYLKPTAEHLALMEKTPKEIDAVTEQHFSDAEKRMRAAMAKVNVENPDQYFPPEPDGFSAQAYIDAMGDDMPPDAKAELVSLELQLKAEAEKTAQEMAASDDDEEAPSGETGAEAPSFEFPPEPPKSPDELLSGLAEGKSFAGQNLSGFDLSGMELGGIDMSQATLDGVNFAGVDMSGAKLSFAVMEKADLSGAKLAGATLAGAVLTGASLIGASLAGMDFSGGS